jgi:CRISPR/Cas system type I-B associated protein Csh2 (Cas7 group RAMP superfamily)
MLKKLSDIEKKLSALPVLPAKPLTNAKSARLALASITEEKPVPSSALKEVLVTVIEEPKDSQSSKRLVESIYAARSSRAGKVLAAQMLNSSNIVITTDSHKTKNLIEHEEK